jgi:hypothetical protein
MIVREYGQYSKKEIRKTFSYIRRMIAGYNKESLQMIQGIMNIDDIANSLGLSLCKTCGTYCLSREVCNNEKF